MAHYEATTIEAFWQRRWAEAGSFRTPPLTGRPKCYVLDMFPYPSGEGLHVGHVKGYIATDVYARWVRMRGFAVLHPMGWDAFGLPAENYALANNIHPRAAVERNIARFKDQLQHIGFSYDWEREINTTDPTYYKWTQWIFVQLFKKGLAYQSDEPINWCPSCKTGLANEDLEDGRCERCGTRVEKKKLRQWVLKITDYAERLLADLEPLDWPEPIKESQRNWIGRSEGAEIEFGIKNRESSIPVFTTRADTLFGATYLVLAPEHPFVAALLTRKTKNLKLKNLQEVEAHVRTAEHKTELMRQEEEKEKSGVELKGVVALNPANGEEIPVWVADYVLMSYGTGAIMAVPAHDERDFAFAQKYNMPVVCVIDPDPAFVAPLSDTLADAEQKTNDAVAAIRQGLAVYTGPGALINSGPFNGMRSEEAKAAVTQRVNGELKVKYKLRDWVFSRQRYWGEPIPIIHCQQCGPVAVPEKDLPVELPAVDHYAPTGTGESPLAAMAEWLSVACPSCGMAGKREANTMPQWAGSSWYYLRYIDPANDKAPVAAEAERAWMPVDLYVGGADHATRHLIYARFWHKFLYDIGVASTAEPFLHLQSVGFILGSDGRKMSKRWGNVVSPDDVIATYGADALRVYEMFMGPFSNAMPWSDESLVGAARWLRRVWKMANSKLKAQHAKLGGSLGTDGVVLMHRTIERVTEAIQRFRFNTGIAALMEWLNELEKLPVIDQETAGIYVRLLAPYAPHLAQELWALLGHDSFILDASWPEYDAALLEQAVVMLPVQVNGRVRGQVPLAADAPHAEVEAAALALPNVARHVQAPIRQVVYVPGKVINFVV